MLKKIIETLKNIKNQASKLPQGVVPKMIVASAGLYVKLLIVFMVYKFSTSKFYAEPFFIFCL